jgi:TfoX/Sxy family transcriptional regulator of competence genes
MGVTDSFRTFTLEQLQRCTSGIRGRNMFGGVGIYAGDLFFALIAGDTLYLKVDDFTRPKFVNAGLRPFRPYGDDGEVMQYYEVAAGVLEDVDALCEWVEDAIGVARRARRSKSPGRAPDSGH